MYLSLWVLTGTEAAVEAYLPSPSIIRGIGRLSDKGGQVKELQKKWRNAE